MKFFVNSAVCSWQINCWRLPYKNILKCPTLVIITPFKTINSAPNRTEMTNLISLANRANWKAFKSLQLFHSITCSRWMQNKTVKRALDAGLPLEDAKSIGVSSLRDLLVKQSRVQRWGTKNCSAFPIADIQ